MESKVKGNDVGKNDNGRGTRLVYCRFWFKEHDSVGKTMYEKTAVELCQRARKAGHDAKYYPLNKLKGETLRQASDAQIAKVYAVIGAAERNAAA